MKKEDLSVGMIVQTRYDIPLIVMECESKKFLMGLEEILPLDKYDEELYYCSGDHHNRWADICRIWKPSKPLTFENLKSWDIKKFCTLLWEREKIELSH